MRKDWKMAAALVVTVGALLGTAIAISFAGAPGGDAANQYEVSVRFNTTVSQDDIDDADVFLRSYDDDMEFVIMESFPPVGRAVVAVGTSDFCQTVEAELVARSYIDGVSCEPWAGGGGGNGDAPVSTESHAER